MSRVTPDACNRFVKVKIHPVGGAFAVPPCSGWSGTIDYPPAPRRYLLNVTSSVRDSFGAPDPPSGTAIFYLRMVNQTHGGGPGFADTGVMDTVTSPMITSGNSYSLIVYNLCYAGSCSPHEENLGSPPPSSNSITFLSPFNGAQFAADASPVWQFIQN
jgi:hypothetical protein